MRIVPEGAVEAKILLLLLLLLNRMTRISVLQLLVSVEKHYLRRSIEESPWSGTIAERKTVLNSLATAAAVPGFSITSATVPALALTCGEGCTSPCSWSGLTKSGSFQVS